MKKHKRDIFVVLHNIRSAHNVGSIFRTADAAGVSKIFLSGYTPLPIDRFLRKRADIAKSALGAEKTVPWKHVASIRSILKELKKQGVAIVAVEQTESAVHYKKLSHRDPVAFVFGNEVRGLSKAILDHCDITILIPMHGSKESLNVSVAVGIILFDAVLD